MTDSPDALPRPREGLVPGRPTPPLNQQLPPIAPAPAPAEPSDPSVMTLVEHLSELRRRVVICVVAIVVGAVIGFWKAEDIIRFLLIPLGRPVIFLSLGAPFLVYVKIALVTGIILGLPVILYQAWGFIAPGLTLRERRQVLPLIPLSVVFFILGVIVAQVTIPFAIQFLEGFQIEGVTSLTPTGEAYFGFVTMVYLVFGAVMEFPIVLVLLAKLGVVRAEQLRKHRRYVLLGIVIFSVVVTPGGDPISPSVMSAVMYALYEFTIFFLGRMGRLGVGFEPTGPAADRASDG